MLLKVQILSVNMVIYYKSGKSFRVQIFSVVMLIYDKYGNAFRSPNIKHNYTNLQQVWF